MSELTPTYVVAMDVITFELISNEAAVSLRWYAGKERYEAMFPPETEITFKARTIFSDQDRLHDPEPEPANA